MTEIEHQHRLFGFLDTKSILFAQSETRLAQYLGQPVHHFAYAPCASRRFIMLSFRRHAFCADSMPTLHARQRKRNDEKINTGNMAIGEPALRRYRQNSSMCRRRKAIQ